MTTNANDKSKMGARLRWAREQAGLSQGQVAKLLHLHRPTISQIEAGDRTVKADEVTWFADLYGVKDDWILRGDDSLVGESDPRIKIAARELRKLKPEDLDVLMRVVQVLRTNQEG